MFLLKERSSFSAYKPVFRLLILFVISLVTSFVIGLKLFKTENISVALYVFLAIVPLTISFILILWNQLSHSKKILRQLNELKKEKEKLEEYQAHLMKVINDVVSALNQTRESLKSFKEQINKAFFKERTFTQNIEFFKDGTKSLQNQI
ncbi:MAG: hypothetical protein D6797_01430, partial [Bdellovibrio sp.]